MMTLKNLPERLMMTFKKKTHSRKNYLIHSLAALVHELMQWLLDY